MASRELIGVAPGSQSEAEPAADDLGDAPLPSVSTSAPTRTNTKRLRAKRSAKKPVFSLDDWTNSLPDETEPAPVEIVPPKRSEVAEASGRPERKRTILSRYVFGGEGEPGSRWKRRMLKSR